MMFPLWMVIALWVALALAYFFLAGLTYRLAVLAAERRCGSCSRDTYCSSDHEFVAFWLAILWPVGVPTVGGIFAASWVADSVLFKKEKELT